MVLDVRDTANHVSEALRQIPPQQMLDHRLQLGVESFRVLRLGVDNLLVNVHWVIVDEGGMSSVHLIDKDAKGPPINRLRVTLIEQDLRCDVLWCSTDRVRSLFDDLSKTKVDEFEVTVLVDHDIFRFQITVYNILGVEVLKNSGNLGTVELCLLSIEITLTSVVGEEIAAREQLSRKIDVSIVLEEAIVA